MKRRVGEILTGLGGWIRTDAASRLRTLLRIFAMACWAAILWRRRELAEIFAGILFVVLALYYSNRPRLVLPLFLLVLPSVVEMAIAGLKTIARPRLAYGIAAALVLLLGIHDADPFADRGDIARSHRRLEDLAHHVSAQYPPEAALAAENGAIYSVHVGRPVYNFGPVCRRSGAEGLAAYIARHEVRGLILNPSTDEPCGMEGFVRDHAEVDDSFSPLRIARLTD